MKSNIERRTVADLDWGNGFEYRGPTRDWIPGGLDSFIWIGVLFACFAAAASGGDWTRFRGPNGSGASDGDQPTPSSWSTDHNIKWTVDLPGPGLSSPIIIGHRVFLTCWTGYGTGDDSVPQEDLRRHLICIDRRNGETIWSREVKPTLPEDPFGGMFAENGYASHSPVSDGERVYVYFGKSGALAFDMDGRQLWHTAVGTESDPRGWGSAASPILFNDLLIVSASAESEALVALNKQTGEEVWRKEAAGFSGSWSTPVLVPVDGDRVDLVTCVPEEVWGFDPATGKLRWYCEVSLNSPVTASVVTQSGVVYVVGGRGGGSAAIRAGGNGNVTDTHIVWRGNDRAGVGSPLLSNDRIYWLTGGVAHCIRSTDGSRVYQSRVENDGDSDEAARTERSGRGRAGGDRDRGGRGRTGGMRGQDYSSPVAADGKLYFISRSGTAYTLSLGDEFTQIAANSFAEPGEQFSATPAISDGELFIRSDRRLYCIADESR